MKIGIRDQLGMDTNSLRLIPAFRPSAELPPPSTHPAGDRRTHWKRTDAPRAGWTLTAREEEVMTLLARGHTVKDIARRLGVSTKTIRNYLSRIFAKLGVHRQAQAVLMWLGHDFDA